MSTIYSYKPYSDEWWEKLRELDSHDAVQTLFFYDLSVYKDRMCQACYLDPGRPYTKAGWPLLTILCADCRRIRRYLWGEKWQAVTEAVGAPVGWGGNTGATSTN